MSFRFVVIAAGVALLGVACWAVWHALHDPAFWVAAFGLAASAVASLVAPVLAKDFGAENAAKVAREAREGRDRAPKAGHREH